MNLNKVQLIGRLGNDPDVKTVGNGRSVANFSLATSSSYKDKNSGERITNTEWHRIVLWGQTADFAGQYIKKGALVYIEGELRTREWDKEGTKHYTTEIHGSEIKPLEKRADAEADNSNSQRSGGYSGNGSNNNGRSSGGYSGNGSNGNGQRSGGHSGNGSNGNGQRSGGHSGNGGNGNGQRSGGHSGNGSNGNGNSHRGSNAVGAGNGFDDDFNTDFMDVPF